MTFPLGNVDVVIISPRPAAGGGGCPVNNFKVKKKEKIYIHEVLFQAK